MDRAHLLVGQAIAVARDLGFDRFGLDALLIYGAFKLNYRAGRIEEALTAFRRAYELGVNGYVVKPVQFEAFLETVSRIGLYWLLANRVPE